MSAVDRFSPEELATFVRDGYYIVSGLTPPPMLAAMRSITAEGLARELTPVEYEADLSYPGAPASLTATGGRTIRRLKQALTRGPTFVEWMLQPAIRNRLQQLLGPSVVCPLAHHNCIMTKQPEFSSDTGWHQDIRYWSFQQPELINAWIALGSEHAENGGLMVIPGSHRTKYRADQFDAELFFRSDLPENQPEIARRVQVTLAPGDVLFFHCLTLHAATRNYTTEPKWSAVFTFRPGNNLPLPGSRSASLPELNLTPGIV